MKDFDLNQILEAINIISKFDSKKTKNIEKKFTNKNDVSTYDNKNGQEILVLQQMME